MCKGPLNLVLENTGQKCHFQNFVGTTECLIQTRDHIV